jgi:hypothetical protein
MNIKEIIGAIIIILLSISLISLFTYGICEIIIDYKTNNYRKKYKKLKKEYEEIQILITLAIDRRKYYQEQYKKEFDSKIHWMLECNEFKQRYEKVKHIINTTYGHIFKID